VFGAGLIEAIEDSTIAANESAVKPFGIAGHANRNGNDGTITRFGWKAQNKSLVIFSGEAYNVEQGITNELFPDERGERGIQDPVACHQVVAAPQDTVNYELSQPQQIIDDASNFANFMRFLAAPAQVSSYGDVTSAQIAAGEAAFNKAGCVGCHEKSMTVGCLFDVDPFEPTPRRKSVSPGARQFHHMKRFQRVDRFGRIGVSIPLEHVQLNRIGLEVRESKPVLLDRLQVLM